MTASEWANVIIAALSITAMAGIYVYNGYAWRKLRRELRRSLQAGMVRADQRPKLPNSKYEPSQ